MSGDERRSALDRLLREHQVAALIEAASAEGLAGAGEEYPSQLAPYLDLDGVSAQTRDLADRLTAGHATPYHRAAALMDYLRGADFRYATRAARPSVASGRDSVDFFLFDQRGRVGFCEQFASAMVVLARSAGIPARLARAAIRMHRTQIAGSTSFHGRRSRARVKDYDTHAPVRAWSPKIANSTTFSKITTTTWLQSTTPNDVIAASS